MMRGEITTSSDRSKSETMHYVLVLNDDYSEEFEEDKGLSERFAPRQCTRNEFLVLHRHNGTKLFHAVCVKNEDGNMCIESAHNKILDICLRCGLKAICVPEQPSNQTEFYESLRANFCSNGNDVTVLLRKTRGGDNNTDMVHSINLRRIREESRIRHRRTRPLVGNSDARRRLNFDTIPEQMEVEE